jgi:hypothetical protein
MNDKLKQYAQAVQEAIEADETLARPAYQWCLGQVCAQFQEAVAEAARATTLVAPVKEYRKVLAAMLRHHEHSVVRGKSRPRRWPGHLTRSAS